jgi:hypothetical protein
MPDVESQRSLAKIIARAWADPEYLARLKEKPRETLTEAGLAPAADVTVHVLQNSQQDFYLVIPQKPPDGPINETRVLETGGLYTLPRYTLG